MEDSKATSSATDDPKAVSIRWPQFQKPGVPFLIFGVLFPATVVVLELVTGMCAEVLFDPMPTIWHVLLVSFVPLANLLVWLRARGLALPYVHLFRMANGAAIAIASYYTLLFAPCLPIALIGIVWGIGLLPMAPLFSLIAAIRGYFYMRRDVSTTNFSRKGGSLLGATIALSAMALICLSEAVTFMGMRMASSRDVSERVRGLDLLRWVGNERIMLQSCLPHRRQISGWSSVLLSGGGLSVGQARRVYYQVTGKTFEDAPASGSRSHIFFPNRRFLFDFHQGGTRVGQKVDQLSLRSSTIDGSVDPDAALAYFEWTLEFENDSPVQAEARAQIGLPPGGVVSRLTLWIDGEPREAAFAGRRKVRKAYQRIVRRKRDPALITSDGADQVLLQCFPVPPSGGTMRLRIGITCPLARVERDRGFLRLPHFVSRNFQQGTTARHHVWIESSRKVSASIEKLAAEQPEPRVHALRGDVTDAELATSAIRVERSADVSAVWTRDRFADDGHVVVQRLDVHRVAAPSRVILVLDGSASMAPFASQIARAVKKLPRGIGFAAVIAGDAPSYLWNPSSAGTGDVYDFVSQRIENHEYAGGCDNVPALALACEIAAKNHGDATILWLHGPQPLELASPLGLRQQWARRSRAPLLYEFQVAPGPDCILGELESVPQLRRVVRINTLPEDLGRLFSGWRDRTEEISLERERIPNDAAPEEGGTIKRTSDHLVRLWALQEVARLRASKSGHERRQAVTLAARYSLVTWVSGAVVLESAAQYREAGLTPVDPDRVPTIPEPETWLLLIVVLVTTAAWFVGGRKGLKCVSA